MKLFKNLAAAFVFTALVLGLHSCTTYHYAFIKTNDRETYQDNNRDFVKEDDRVSVSYCFFGHDLPVQITVENKTSKPVFVNWNESALIVEDAAQSYNHRRIITSGQFITTTYHYRDYFQPRETISDAYGEYRGETVLPEEISFIPPYSRIVKTPLVLKDLHLDKMPKSIFTERVYPSYNGKEISMKTADFTERNTPLRFKSYLTFFTQNERGRRDYTWSNEQSFYISSILKGGNKNPKNTRAFARQDGDMFFVSKTENVTLWGVVAVIGTIGVLWIATEAMVPDIDMPSF